jgi:hypothetical protein
MPDADASGDRAARDDRSHRWYARFRGYLGRGSGIVTAGSGAAR